MTDQNLRHRAGQATRGWRHLPGLVAIGALMVAGLGLYLVLHQPKPASIGLPHGVVVVAACAFLAGLIAEIRAMSLSDLVEAVLESMARLVSLVAAALAAVWAAFLGLLGW